MGGALRPETPGSRTRPDDPLPLPPAPLHLGLGPARGKIPKRRGAARAPACSLARTFALSLALSLSLSLPLSRSLGPRERPGWAPAPCVTKEAARLGEPREPRCRSSRAQTPGTPGRGSPIWACWTGNEEGWTQIALGPRATSASSGDGEWGRGPSPARPWDLGPQIFMRRQRKGDAVLRSRGPRPQPQTGR